MISSQVDAENLGGDAAPESTREEALAGRFRPGQTVTENDVRGCSAAEMARLFNEMSVKVVRDTAPRRDVRESEVWGRAAQSAAQMCSAAADKRNSNPKRLQRPVTFVPLKGTQEESYITFRSRLMEHFDLMEFDEKERLKALPFFLADTAYRQWMTAAEEHKRSFKAALKWMDEGHEREKNLESLQAKFKRIKYPGPQKMSIRGFLSELKLYAAEAWPETEDGDDENKIARELAINQKLWDALPNHVKDHVKARTSKRDGIKTEEILETAESIMTSRDDEVAEDAPYRYGSVNQVAAKPKNPKIAGKVPEWVADIRRKHLIMATEMQLENQKAMNNITQQAMTIAQAAAQTATPAPAQPQPQQPQQYGGGSRGRGSRGRRNGCESGGSAQRQQPERSQVQCFRCKQMGHFARECPEKENARNTAGSKERKKDQTREEWIQELEAQIRDLRYSAEEESEN